MKTKAEQWQEKRNAISEADDDARQDLWTEIAEDSEMISLFKEPYAYRRFDDGSLLGDECEGVYASESELLKAISDFNEERKNFKPEKRIILEGTIEHDPSFQYIDELSLVGITDLTGKPFVRRWSTDRDEEEGDNASLDYTAQLAALDGRRVRIEVQIEEFHKECSSPRGNMYGVTASALCFPKLLGVLD
jgi:hypothetical protein